MPFMSLTCMHSTLSLTSIHIHNDLKNEVVTILMTCSLYMVDHISFLADSQ